MNHISNIKAQMGCQGQNLNSSRYRYIQVKLCIYCRVTRTFTLIKIFFPFLVNLNVENEIFSIQSFKLSIT